LSTFAMTPQAITGTGVLLEAVPLACCDGIRVLVEMLKFMLKIAKTECEPGLALTIGRPIGNAYFCMLSDARTGKTQLPTVEQLNRFESVMHDIIELALPVQYATVPCQIAIDKMAKTGAGLTASMLKDCNMAQVQKFNIAIAPIPALQLDALHVLSGTTIRMLRRMVRDYLNRGRPVLTTLRQWPSVAAGEVSNIYPHQIHADAVMNSEIAYEISVLKVHVEPLLNSVPPTEREYSEVRRLLKTLEQVIALPTNVIPPQSLIREFVGGSWYYDFGGWYKDY